jgi:hypothetical protein
MKKFILIAFLIPIFSISQEHQNFKNENNILTWEKVYESDLNSTEISEILTKDAVLNSLSEGFTGQSIPEKIKCEARQAIFMDGSFQYYASIEFKEGRYRVQVSSIELIPSITIALYGVRSSEGPEAYSGYILKNNGDWRTNTLAQNSIACLNQYFSNKFEFTSTEKDW